jgi:hypothetical protein
MTTPDKLDADDINDNAIDKYLTQNWYSTSVLAVNAEAEWSNVRGELLANRLVARIQTPYSILESMFMLNLPMDVLRTISWMHRLTLKEISISYWARLLSTDLTTW